MSDEERTTSFVDKIKKSRALENLYLFRGKDINGRQAWYYILLRPNRKVAFMREYPEGNFNLDDYGEVLLSGFGQDPPPDAVQYMEEEYEFVASED